MNTFIQHIPNYIGGIKPAKFKFDTTEELLANEYVAIWTTHDGFQNFAMSYDSLMAIFDNGKMWYVVGFISEPNEIDLPQFTTH